VEPDFKTRLLNTLRALQPVLGEPGVLVAGSEVPNLLQPDAASTLVVSQDVDVAVSVRAVTAIKERLRGIEGLAPSRDEPSVWLPTAPGLLEANFIGMDDRRPGETYVREDPELPLLVFGHLSWLRPGKVLELGSLRVPLPRPAGLILEKLVTDRSGEKGDRDLLVALGLLVTCDDGDLREMAQLYRDLQPEDRYAVRSGLSTLSLLAPRPQMPDPVPHRGLIARILAALEQGEPR
jgi:hypothetical protein